MAEISLKDILNDNREYAMRTFKAEYLIMLNRVLAEFGYGILYKEFKYSSFRFFEDGSYIDKSSPTYDRLEDILRYILEEITRLELKIKGQYNGA
jgi:hypothetical protein